MAQQFRSFSLLPPVIKNLLIINGLGFLATYVLGNSFGIDLNRMLGLYLPVSPEFRPYQIVTHMFMHGNFGHIFSNMFALWMFGTPLENLWGGKRFLTFYLVTGLGAALCHLGVNYYEYTQMMNHLVESGASVSDLHNLFATRAIENSLTQFAQSDLSPIYHLVTTPTVGASGAVFGILLGFGMIFPNQVIYIYFMLPLKAKYFVIIYGLFELYAGFNGVDSNIAHFAHIGGMIFGYFLIKHWRKFRYY